MEKTVVVFDLDGTLSNGDHRAHLAPPEHMRDITPAWDAFNLAAGDDEPIIDNISLLLAMQRHYQIVILTGRCAVAKSVTENWLASHRISDVELIMRPETDYRRDTDFKEEVLRRIGIERILCCFDDLERVARHIRSMGVTCHLVTHYDTPGLHEK